ncbi:MAG: hypothetical protein Wins2KO_04020 [Winogradskyella sp.]
MKNLQIVGNLGQDAKLINNQFLSFNVAVSTYVGKDNQGNAKYHTDWIEVNSNNKSLEQHLKKGKKIFVSGTPKFSTYTDKDGNLHSKVNLYAQNITLC